MGRTGSAGDSTVDLDQCMYHAETKKATTIGGNVEFLSRLRRQCCHRIHSGRSRGYAHGKFLSAKTSTYPSELCRSIAALHVNHYKKRRKSAVEFGDQPGPYYGARALQPNGRARAPLPPPCKDVWPEAEAGCFLDWFAEATVSAAVFGRSAPLC